MSADNYFVVDLEDDYFTVRMGFVSDELGNLGKPHLKTKDLAEAITYAQDQNAEYGYSLTQRVILYKQALEEEMNSEEYREE